METKSKKMNRLEKIAVGIAWGLGVSSAILLAKGAYQVEINDIYLGTGLLVGSILPATVSATSYILRIKDDR
jgi:hypothetical protein